MGTKGEVLFTVIAAMVGVAAFVWMFYRAIQCGARGGDLVPGAFGYVCVEPRR